MGGRHSYELVRRVALELVAVAEATAAATAVASTVTTTSTVAATTTVEATSTATTTTAEEATTATTVAASAMEAATTATAATTSTALRTVAGDHGLEPFRASLVVLVEVVTDLIGDVLVLLIEEGDGNTGLAGTTCAADAVNVVVKVAGEIELDDKCDVGDVEATGSDVSGNENLADASLEQAKGIFTFALHAVTVDGGALETKLVQDAVEIVGIALALDEYQHEAVLVLHQDLAENLTLVVVLNPADVLGDVLSGGADAANLQEVVLAEELTGELLDLTRERGGVHEGLAGTSCRHVGLRALDDGADLGLETHVEHAVGLIEYHVLDLGELDDSALVHFPEAARGGGEDVAATSQLVDLLARVGTSVHNHAAEAGAVSELAAFVVNLNGQFTRGSHDETSGEGCATGAALRTALEGVADGRNEVGGGLARTSLGAGHQVITSNDNRDTVLLDGCGLGVVTHADVVLEGLWEVHLCKGLARRDVVGLDRDLDVFVVVEVDASGVILEEIVHILVFAGVGLGGSTSAATTGAEGTNGGRGIGVGVLAWGLRAMPEAALEATTTAAAATTTTEGGTEATSAAEAVSALVATATTAVTTTAALVAAATLVAAALVAATTLVATATLVTATTVVAPLVLLLLGNELAGLEGKAAATSITIARGAITLMWGNVGH